MVGRGRRPRENRVPRRVPPQHRVRRAQRLHQHRVRAAAGLGATDDPGPTAVELQTDRQHQAKLRWIGQISVQALVLHDPVPHGWEQIDGHQEMQGVGVDLNPGQEAQRIGRAG